MNWRKTHLVRKKSISTPFLTKVALKFSLLFTSGISLKSEVKLGSRKQNELDFDHQNPKNKNKNCQIFVLDSSRPPKYIQ
jgi:hypothetical protein